ncbi:MAG: SurA N-terminal domain-containing protein [Rhodoblastus sp.]
MLDGLRTASQSWFGKAIMTIVFGVIIVSFAIWGIGDIFRGSRPGRMPSTVGSTEISSRPIDLPTRANCSACSNVCAAW